MSHTALKVQYTFVSCPPSERSELAEILFHRIVRLSVWQRTGQSDRWDIKC